MFPGASKIIVTSPNALSATSPPIADDLETLLFDPQTAGGLLVSVAQNDCEELVVEMQSAGIPARSIGKVTGSQKPLIRIY